MTSDWLTSDWILRSRPSLPRPEPSDRLLGQQDEWEPSSPQPGCNSVRVRTLFLRGSECRFRCTMCDLWQYTHLEPTQPGHIPQQIQSGLADIASLDPPPVWLKLYNAASFFDSKNIPAVDLPAIAHQVRGMQRVIVENHPRLLISDLITDFRDRIQPARLEIAMGLETVHTEVLRKLNKQMTLADFQNAVQFCHNRQVAVRAFVLLQTPWLDHCSAMKWCQASIDAARDMGVEHISVIPMRAGNGAMDLLAHDGEFDLPTAAMLEQILTKNLAHTDSLITADLWDWDKLRGTCQQCSGPRRFRLAEMNLHRRFLPSIPCERCDVSEAVG